MPELWSVLGKNDRKKLCEDWRGDDPEGFARQEERRRAYNLHKKARAVPVGIVVPCLSRKDSEQQEGGDRQSANDSGELVLWVCTGREESDGAATALVAMPDEIVESGKPCRNRCSSGDDIQHVLRVEGKTTETADHDDSVIADCCTERLVESGKAHELVYDAKTKILSGHFDVLVIELCCERDSEIGDKVPSRALRLRVTKDLDLAARKTRKDLHEIITFAARMNLPVLLWISVECTAGCRWRRVSDRLGRATGDLVLTETLIDAGAKLCKHNIELGGMASWEWPSTSEL